MAREEMEAAQAGAQPQHQSGADAMRIPPQLIALDAVGTLLAGVGVAGLVTDLSGLLPFLANRDVAGAMTGAGFALMAFAIFRIVQHLRAQHRRPWK
jgi:hypothetical protein